MRRSRIGSRSRSRVDADAAAEDDERDVGDGRDRGDVERDPARLLLHHRSARSRRRRARRRRSRARRTAAAASSSRRPRRRAARRARRSRDAHGSIVLVAPGRDEVDLAGRAVTAAVQLAAQHEAGAEAGADREEHEVLDAPRHAAPALADRGEVDVVLDASPAARVACAGPRPSRDPRGRGRWSRASAGRCRRRRRPGTPTTAPSIRSAGARSPPRARSRRPAIASIAPSASAPSSSTSCRARISPRRSQIAPRRKRAPRSRPSTSPASGTTSKKVAP